MTISTSTRTSNSETLLPVSNGLLIPSKPRLADRVYSHVVTNISNGNFTPGQKLREKAIAKQLHISHVPVREAMERLHQKGWIDRFPQRGAYVKDLNAKEVTNVFQIREVLEAGCVRIIVELITAEQLEELKVAVGMLSSASEKRDPALYEKWDCRFHSLLVNFTKNPGLIELFNTVILQSRAFFLSGSIQAAFSWGKNLEKIDFASHKHIYETVASRNTAKAEKAIIEHCRGGCNLALMTMKTQEVLRESQ